METITTTITSTTTTVNKTTNLVKLEQIKILFKFYLIRYTKATNN